MRAYHYLVGAAALSLCNPASAGEIRGTVTGPDARPVKGAQVLLDDLARGDTSGEDGRFVLTQIPSGEIGITITAPGLAAKHVSVPVSATGSVDLPVKLEATDLLDRAAALYAEPQPEHLAQKKAYLDSIKPIAGRPPNILLILFDDLGYGDLSSYGNRLIKTPNIDAVGARGVRLDRFYSSSPVCSPSRAGLLTGRYPTRSRAANHVFAATGGPTAIQRQSRGWTNALPTDEILLPEILSRAGYRTGAFGKWHLGDRPGARPTDLGFDEYFGLLYSNDMSPANVWRGTEIDTPAERMDQSTLTERITDEALAFIRGNANRPFFAYVPYTAPHQPHFANPKHRGVSEGGTYGDVVEDLDVNVGRLIGALKDLKLDDNTIVIVTSDNGGDFGGSVGDLRGRKAETFEGGQRVPLFVVWPGKIAPGTRSEEMAMNIDITPTLLAALGIGLPQDRIVDGRDIGPLLLHGGPSPHDYLYYLTWTGQYEGVRDRGFKFRDPVPNTRLLNFRPSGGRPALYVMEEDNESLDVSAKHPEERSTLERQLEQFRQETSENVRGWRTP